MRTDKIARRLLRDEAKKMRVSILIRSRRCCEVCGWYCPFTMAVHHVKPVRKSDINDPGPLIGLCPNCHATIHQVNKRRSHPAHATFEQWLEMTYTPWQVDLIKAIADEGAHYFQGKWQRMGQDTDSDDERCK